MRKSLDVDISSAWVDGRPYMRPRCADDPVPVPLDWRRLFGNDKPVELEIGCGKGLFLWREAQRRPQRNFVGVEWAAQYAKPAAARLVRAGVTNARIIGADFRRLSPQLASGQVAAVHVYFPDPWWKRRHRKRRLFDAEFVTELARLLAAKGILSVATDVTEYFAAIVAAIEKNGPFDRIPDPPPHLPEHDLDYLTHFERKFRQQGRQIHRAQYQFCPGRQNFADR